MALQSVTSPESRLDFIEGQALREITDARAATSERIVDQTEPDATADNHRSGAVAEHIVYDPADLFKDGLRRRLNSWPKEFAEDFYGAGTTENAPAQAFTAVRTYQAVAVPRDGIDEAQPATMPETELAGEKTLLNMTPEELGALPDEMKRQLLAQFGIPLKHLDGTKGEKLDRAFMKVVDALKTPGQQKLTLKLDKKYELKLNIGQDGEILSAEAKKKKGFWGKLGGALKTALAIAGPVLAPFTGGASLIASSAVGAVDAIKNKNWLGAIGSVAGMFVPGAGSVLGKTVGQVASAVQRGAFAVQSGMLAFKARSPGTLLASIAGGVSAFAGGINRASGSIAEAGRKLEWYANIAYRGESIIRSVRNRDYFGAASSALGTAAGLAEDGSQLRKELRFYAGVVNQADRVQWALRGKNYLYAASGALGLADDLGRHSGFGFNLGDGKLKDALRLTESGALLEAAVRGKDPARIAQATLALGSTVNSLRNQYWLEGGAGGKFGEGLFKTWQAIGWADRAIRAAKNGDYAGAAAEALALAAGLSGNKNLAQADRIGNHAALLVNAIRSRDNSLIGWAASALVEEVRAQRAESWLSRQQLVDEASGGTQQDTKNSVGQQDDPNLKGYTVIFPLPESYKAQGKEASRWALTYSVVKNVFEHNGVKASPAAIEEVVALMGNLDFTSGFDSKGNLRRTYSDGLWLNAATYKDANGNDVYGYKLTMVPEFQQYVLRHKEMAEQITRAGTKGLSEMRMTERMKTAIAIAYDKHLGPEVKKAFGNISAEQLAVAMAAGGAVGILVKRGASSALGPIGAGIGAGLALYDITEKYVEFHEFVRLTGEAKTQADLDKAAQQFAKLAAEMASDGVIALAAGAAAKVAPGVSKKVDDVVTSGVKGIDGTFNNPVRSNPVLVPEGGPLPGPKPLEARSPIGPTGVNQPNAPTPSNGTIRRAPITKATLSSLSVPSVKNGEFARWFNGLTKEEIDLIWTDQRLRDAIEARLRSPGGYHEWLMVSRAPKFREWGVTAEQIWAMRTPTSRLEFVNPPGRHGGKESGTVHKEILQIIDSSGSFTEFKAALQAWANRRLPGGANSLPEGLRR